MPSTLYFYSAIVQADVFQIPPQTPIPKRLGVMRTNHQLVKVMTRDKIIIPYLLFCLFFFFQPTLSFGQSSLQTKFEQIAKNINGNVGVCALIIETGETISFNGDKRFPMQSVYKLPIAMAMLDKVDKGKFKLNQIIHIDKSEYIPKYAHSPIRDKFPNGISLSIKEVIRYNIEESDGTACDVLLRLLGGPENADQYIHKLGITDIAISTTEMAQQKNDTIQYQNWTTPKAMSQLLKIFYNTKSLSGKSKALLIDYMSVSSPWFDKRIKRLLPPSTTVVHKTGTSGTINGLTRATNDVGIITLPNGKHLAISIFISDSYASKQNRELTIAKISRAAFDYWRKR